MGRAKWGASVRDCSTSAHQASDPLGSSAATQDICDSAAQAAPLSSQSRPGLSARACGLGQGASLSGSGAAVSNRETRLRPGPSAAPSMEEPNRQLFPVVFIQWQGCGRGDVTGVCHPTQIPHRGQGLAAGPALCPATKRSPFSR